MSRLIKARSLHAVLASACVVLWSYGCSTIQPAVVVEPGASFALAQGQTATVRGTDTRITFNLVREDSRCPVDVTCVWEGDAKIEIVVAPSDSASTRTLSLRSPNETRVGNLRIRFVGLSPVPRQADGNTPRNYLAEFVAEQS